MNKKQAEQLLNEILIAALCPECGCWEEGYTTYITKTKFGYTCCAWPNLDEDGEGYPSANFNFALMLDALYASGDTIIEALHFCYEMSVFTVKWRPVNPHSTVLTLNLFIDPVGREAINDVLLVQDSNAVLAVVPPTEASNTAIAYAKLALDGGMSESSEKPRFDKSLLCDVLVVAGFNADESMLPDIEQQLLQDGLAWARAQAFGSPVTLIEEQPPAWILDLERIRG